MCYSNTIWWDEEDQAWFAKIPRLPGLMTHAEKKEDVPPMFEDAKRRYLEARLERGMKIAEPERTRA